MDTPFTDIVTLILAKVAPRKYGSRRYLSKNDGLSELESLNAPETDRNPTKKWSSG